MDSLLESSYNSDLDVVLLSQLHVVEKKVALKFVVRLVNLLKCHQSFYTVNNYFLLVSMTLAVFFF